MVYIIRGKNQNEKTQHVYGTYRSYKRFYNDSFCAEFRNENWNIVLNAGDPNESLNEFNRSVLRICDKHAPIRKRRVQFDRPPWINADILNVMRERDAMKQKAIERTLKENEEKESAENENNVREGKEKEHHVKEIKATEEW